MRIVPPPCSLRGRLSHSGGTPSVMGLSLGGDWLLRSICAFAYLRKAAFHRVDEEVKRFLRSHKSDYFRFYCESLSPSAGLGNIWQTVSSMSARRSSGCSGVTNSLDSPEFRAMQDELVQPQCVPADLPRIETIDESDSMNAPFPLREFSAALASWGAHTSPGLDEVKYRIVRGLSSFSHEFLLAVFNRMFRDSSFPESWRNTLVVFIPKSGSGKSRSLIAEI